MQPNPMDVRKILDAYFDTWIHAMTLQELIESEDERTYEDVKPKYEKEAAHRFALLYTALEDPSGFARAVKEFLDMNPKNGPAQ